MPTILAILSAVAQMRNLFNHDTLFTNSTPNYYQNNNTDVQGWLGIPFKK